MNYFIFTLLFVFAFLAANAMFLHDSKDPPLVQCNATHPCKAPTGCFHDCYGPTINGRPIPHAPICGEFCIDKKMKCEEDLNCPRRYHCTASKHSKEQICKPIFIGK